MLKIRLTLASGEISICAPGVRPFWPNVHPDLSTCGQLEKVTGVLFGTPRYYLLQKLKMMLLSIRS